jgi:hypothetical protein
MIYKSLTTATCHVLLALLSYKLGDFQDSYQLVQKALTVFPDHADSKDLVKLLRQHFMML